MAVALKYSTEFKDVEGATWLVLFSEEAWGGAVTTFTPGPTPISIRWNQTDKYQPIIGSVASIQLLYESAIDDLYTEESQSIRVDISSGGTLWQGWLSPGQYFRQFNNPVHMVTLTASDGLGELKNIKFTGILDYPYYYSTTEAVVIANILLKTGLSVSIYDAINVYEDSYDSTTADSPLDQTYIWPEMYWDELTDERANCYDVLVDILKKYGATVRYSYGHWYLLRPNDYSVNDDIYYRVISTLGNVVSNSSFTSYNSIGSNMFYIHADQEVTKVPSYGSGEVALSPVKRTNDLKNGSFDSFAWSATDVPYYWGHSSTVPNYDKTTVANNLTLYTNEAATQPTLYLHSRLIHYIDIKSIRLTLNYRCYYQLSPTHVKICVGIKVGSGKYYDPENDTWSSTSWALGTSAVAYDLIAESRASSATTISTIVVEPSTGPFTVNGEGIYGAGNYIEVYLYELWNETTPGGVANWLSYESVFLEIERSGAFPDTRVYTWDAPGYVSNIYKDELKLGDSFILDTTRLTTDDIYYGYTSKVQGGAGDETEDWFIKGHNPTVTAPVPIAELLARQVVEGSNTSMDLIRGSIRSAYTNVPHLAMEDSNFTDAYGFTKRFLPRGIAYDVHRNEYSGEWVECPALYSDTGYDWNTHDCGGDATITDNSIEINNWTAVAGYWANFDSYTAVAGETIRLVVEMTDDGSSYIPGFYIDTVLQTRGWGTNYYTYYCATAGSKAIQLGGAAGQNINCTIQVDLYGITGV